MQKIVTSFVGATLVDVYKNEQVAKIKMEQSKNDMLKKEKYSLQLNQLA